MRYTDSSVNRSGRFCGARRFRTSNVGSGPGSSTESSGSEAAAAGLVGFEAPERYGGLGIADFRFNAVLDEEVEYTGSVGDGFTMENDIVVHTCSSSPTTSSKPGGCRPFTAGELSPRSR